MKNLPRVLLYEKCQRLFLSLCCFFSVGVNYGQDSWTQRASMPDSFSIAASFAIGDNGYIATGRFNSSLAQGDWTNYFWKYNSSSDIWIKLPDFPGAKRAAATGFAVNGKGYIGTGLSDDENPVLNDFWEYNPSSSSWVQKASLPADPRSGAKSFVIGNKAYVGGGFGYGATGLLWDLWEFDPASNSWAKMADLPGEADFAFSIGNKGYVGMYTSSGIDFWQFDSGANIWIKKASPPIPSRGGVVAFAMEGKGYFGLGQSSGGVYNKDIWEYNPASNTWTQKKNFPANVRVQSSAFIINTKAFVTGGVDQDQRYGDLWEYTSCTPPPMPTAANTTICANNTASLSATGTGTLGWYSQATGGIYLVGGANYTTPILNTTTTYYVQDSICAASATRKAILVTVNPLPTITANASATHVCAGASVTLSGEGANSYIWSGGVSNGIGFIPNTTTTYTVTGTDGNNCSNTATKTIHVNPLPTVTANASATNLCAGASVTLTGGGATSYTWSGGVTNGIGFIPITTTTYIVTGTDGNNCSNTATKTIHVNLLPTVSANASATIVCAGTAITLSGDGATSYTWSGGVMNGLSFVPSTSATYTVTGTDGNNCSNTATKTINVNPLPTVTAIATATDVCEGTIVTLTGGGAASYIWSNGITNGVAFVTSTTTTYTVIGTDGNNCSNTATQTITVTPLLDLTTSLTGLTISANQNGAIYQWLDCNNGNSVIAGATSKSYTASINGNYAVIVKMNSCLDTSTCVNVSITGIEKIAENNIQLKVFPNPGNGSITVTLSGVEGQSINEMIYTIKNESGQMIQTFKLNTSNNYTVNIENLSNGIYFIVGLNNNKMTNQKVVVTK